MAVAAIAALVALAVPASAHDDPTSYDGAFNTAKVARDHHQHGALSSRPPGRNSP
ncbi:MAG: hypothetical protein ACRDZ0_06040 [Acidimicrobiales bacterium]